MATALCIAGLMWFAQIQWGWRRRTLGAAGLAWIAVWAAGCGSGGSGGAAHAQHPWGRQSEFVVDVAPAVVPGSPYAASLLRERIPDSSAHGRVLATSAAVSQARRAVATP